jgi:voltage-gated potassium channel
MTLEHLSFVDALLTTVSAISTVGYSPPRPLSLEGKVLAIVLILGGVTGIALVISVMTEYFMEGQLHGVWERTRVDRAISRLKDHFIIVGFGRVGKEVARQLSGANRPFVIVDTNDQAIEAAREAGYLYWQGDPSSNEVLMHLGVDRAGGLIACADSDVQNVYVTLTARTVNPTLFIVARAAYADAEPKLYNAGANRVVSPYVMAGRQIAQIAVQPRLADHLSFLFDGKQIGVQIVEIRVEDMPDLAGQRIAQLHNSLLHGAFVLAIDRDDERLEHISGEEIIQPHDRLLVVGSGAAVQKLATIE